MDDILACVSNATGILVLGFTKLTTVHVASVAELNYKSNSTHQAQRVSHNRNVHVSSFCLTGGSLSVTAYVLYVIRRYTLISRLLADICCVETASLCSRQIAIVFARFWWFVLWWCRHIKHLSKRADRAGFVFSVQVLAHAYFWRKSAHMHLYTYV